MDVTLYIKSNEENQIKNFKVKADLNIFIMC